MGPSLDQNGVKSGPEWCQIGSRMEPSLDQNGTRSGPEYRDCGSRNVGFWNQDADPKVQDPASWNPVFQYAGILNPGSSIILVPGFGTLNTETPSLVNPGSRILNRVLDPAS